LSMFVQTSHSIGLMWWLLTREVLRLRGSISREVPWEIMVDLYFYRDPNEEVDSCSYCLLLPAFSRTEVFNLCHAVDRTGIPSSGGGPHGPRRTGFNLSYSWLDQNMSY